MSQSNLRFRFCNFLLKLDMQFVTFLKYIQQWLNVSKGKSYDHWRFKVIFRGETWTALQQKNYKTFVLVCLLFIMLFRKLVSQVTGVSNLPFRIEGTDEVCLLICIYESPSRTTNSDENTLLLLLFLQGLCYCSHHWRKCETTSAVLWGGSADVRLWRVNGRKETNRYN